MSTDQIPAPDDVIAAGWRAYFDAETYTTSDIEAGMHATYAAGVAAGRKQAADAIAELRKLISDLTDFDREPCRFDHHGYCQAHGWMATEPRCPYARAKELLAERTPDPR